VHDPLVFAVRPLGFLLTLSLCVHLGLVFVQGTLKTFGVEKCGCQWICNRPFDNVHGYIFLCIYCHE